MFVLPNISTPCPIYLWLRLRAIWKVYAKGLTGLLNSGPDDNRAEILNLAIQIQTPMDSKHLF